MQVFISEAELLQTAELEVFDQHVAALDKLLDGGDAFRFGEVDGDRALIAIAAEVVAAFGRVAAVAILDVRRAPRARLVADARSLNFDDFGAEISEQLCAGRSCKNPAEIEYSNSSQRSA